MSTTTATVTEPAAHAAITAACKVLDLPGIQKVAEPLPDAVARQHHGDSRLAAAIVDRLTFRGHIISTGAMSYLLKTTQTQPRSRPPVGLKPL